MRGGHACDTRAHTHAGTRQANAAVAVAVNLRRLPAGVTIVNGARVSCGSDPRCSVLKVVSRSRGGAGQRAARPLRFPETPVVNNTPGTRAFVSGGFRC